MPHQKSANQSENTDEAPGMALRRQLLSCMAKELTSRQYQVFVLHFLEGMTQVEIAEEFGLTTSSVNRAYRGALNKLRVCMGFAYETEEYEDYDE